MAKIQSLTDQSRGAIIRGEVDTMRRLLAEGLPLNPTEDTSPLARASKERQVAIVRLLIEAGADVNETDTEYQHQSLLMHAASDSHLPIVQALLAAGANVNQRDKQGRSALREASGKRTGAALEVVRVLLAAGATADAEALTQAARQGSPDILRALVAAGAKPNEAGSWGLPLGLAVEEGRRDNVVALLLLGADVNVRHKEKSALDVAREQNDGRTVAVLEAAANGTLPVAPPTPTATATDVPALWQRLRAVVAAEVVAGLQPGTTEAALAQLEAALGLTLPADFRASYLLVNGQEQGGDGLIPSGTFTDEGYVLLAVESILDEWQPWVGLIEMNEFRGQVSCADPGVRDDWWHRGWIPFASNGGGDSLCLDLAPAEGGTVGQVIAMSHETGDRPLVAKSFAEFLALLAQRLEDAKE